TGQSTFRLNPAYQAIGARDALDGGALLFANVGMLLQPTPPQLDAEALRHLRPYTDLACSFDYLVLFGPAPADKPLPALQAVAHDV
ncbi:hypothetical protein J8J40_30400, partial [Mycobacterium tuberculosis]|nr:hypothetical protein [Mycobacterium tuberculosis]